MRPRSATPSRSSPASTRQSGGRSTDGGPGPGPAHLDEEAMAVPMLVASRGSRFQEATVTRSSEIARLPAGRRPDDRNGVVGRMPARSPQAQARQLFAPLGPTYDRVGASLSLGQDPRWRRFLVTRLPRGGHVLDVATGTGLVAAALLRRGFGVTGLDLSPEMLAVARRRFGEGVELIQ